MSVHAERHGRRADPVALRDLPELTALRDRPAIVYCGQINHDTPRMFYEYLRRAGSLPRLDVVLATTGGLATAAHRTALLLHERTDHLAVLVPHRAWSAGTLLCLGSQELVLGPMAELSPLDPRITGTTGPGAERDVLSARTVRAFRDLAEDWFGVTDPAARIQVLALLTQRVSPTSLAEFYRADRMVRDIATELLRHHLPDADEPARRDLADRLVTGYDAHDYGIGRQQARDLGLRVTYPDDAEEDLLWRVLEECHREMAAAGDEQATALLLGTALRVSPAPPTGPPRARARPNPTPAGRS